MPWEIITCYYKIPLDRKNRSLFIRLVDFFFMLEVIMEFSGQNILHGIGNPVRSDVVYNCC